MLRIASKCYKELARARVQTYMRAKITLKTPTPSSRAILSLSSIKRKADKSKKKDTMSVTSRGINVKITQMLWDERKYIADLFAVRYGDVGGVILNQEHRGHLMNRTWVRQMKRALLSATMDSRNVVAFLATYNHSCFSKGTDFHTILKYKKNKDYLQIRQFLKELYELQVLASTMNKPTMVAAGGHCFNSASTFFASLPFPVALDNLTMKHEELSSGLGLHAGALFFLSRMPGHAGKFYALTGLPFNRYDAKLLGYTEHLSEEGVNVLQPFHLFTHKMHGVMKVKQFGHWSMHRFINDDPRFKAQNRNKKDLPDFLKAPEEQLQNEFDNTFHLNQPYTLPELRERDYNAGTNLEYKKLLMEKDRASAPFKWRNKNSRLFQEHQYPNYMSELLEVFETTLGEGENREGFIQNKSTYYKNRVFIEKCFFPDNMEQIVENLEKELDNPDNCHLARICLERIKQSPPLSLKATLALLNKAKIWDYTTCMKEEYKLLWNLIKHPNFDVAMENRKVKQSDKWGLFEPSTLEDVSDKMVEEVLKPAKDMLTENPAEVNTGDPLQFNVPTNALLPHRFYHTKFQDPIRLWINENRICFETYVRQDFYIQLRGQLLNRGIDYREGTVNAAAVREGYYRQDLLRRVFEQELYDLQMLSSHKEIADNKYEKILSEIGRYFSIEPTEDGKMVPLEPSQARIEEYTKDMNERVKEMFTEKWKEKIAWKHEKFKNAKTLEKRRMLLRLKKWIIQKRLLSIGNDSVIQLTTRGALLQPKSFYIPKSVNERWRIGENPELKKSIFYHIMKCISRDNVPLPPEALEDYLSNPGQRFKLSVNVLDTEALEALGKKLESNQGIEQIAKTLELDPDDEFDKAIDREVELYKMQNYGKIPLSNSLPFRLYFRTREVRKRKNALQLNSFRKAVRMALEHKRAIQKDQNLINLDKQTNLWKLVNKGQFQRLEKMHPELEGLKDKLKSAEGQKEQGPSISEFISNPLLALEGYFEGDQKLKSLFLDQEWLSNPLVASVFTPIQDSMEEFSKILGILNAEKEYIPSKSFDKHFLSSKGALAAVHGMQLAKSLRPIVHFHHLDHLESNIDKALKTVTELWGAPQEIVARALNMQMQILNREGYEEVDLAWQTLLKNMDGVSRVYGEKPKIELAMRKSLHEGTIGEFFRHGFKDSSEIPHFQEAMEYLKNLTECTSKDEMRLVPKLSREKVKEMAEAVRKRYFRWTKEKYFRAKHSKHFIGPELDEPLNELEEKYGEEIGAGLTALVESKEKLTPQALYKIMKAQDKLYVELEEDDFRTVKFEEEEFKEPEHYHDMKKQNWTEDDMEGEPDTDLALQSFDPYHYQAFHVHKKHEIRNVEEIIENNDPWEQINLYRRKVLLEIKNLQKYIENEPQVMKLLAEMNYDHKKDLHTLAFQMSQGNEAEYGKLISKYQDVFAKYQEGPIYKAGTLKKKFDDLMKLMNLSYKKNGILGKQAFNEIVTDIVETNYKERAHLKFKVANGWTLDFKELLALYNSKATMVENQKSLKESLDKFARRYKPKPQQFSLKVLNIMKRLQKQEKEEVPLSSVIEELKVSGDEETMVEFLEKINRRKFKYSERKVGYRLWLEAEARNILSELNPGQALEYLVKCIEGIKPRGSTKTLHKCLKQNWPELNLSQSTTKEQFLHFVKWIGGIKAFFERDPETNSADMNLYLKRLRHAINTGAAKLEGDSHSLDEISKFKLKYDVDAEFLSSLNKTQGSQISSTTPEIRNQQANPSSEMQIDKEGFKEQLKKGSLYRDVLESNIDVVSLSELSELVETLSDNQENSEIKENIGSIVSAINGELAGVSHETRQRLTVADYLSSFKNTMLDYQIDALPKYLGNTQLKAPVHSHSFGSSSFEPTRRQVFEKITSLQNKDDLRFKNEFQNEMYGEMLLSQDKEEYKVKFQELLQNYLQIRLQIAEGHPEYQVAVTNQEERKELAQFLGNQIIKELSLDVNPSLDFESKFNYDSVVKKKEKKIFEKQRYGLPELRNDEFLGISFEEQKEREGQLFKGKYELASGMHDDVGYDTIPENLATRREIEIVPEEHEFGRYKTMRNYNLEAKKDNLFEREQSKAKNPFDNWLKEYYVGVRESIKNAKDIDKYLRDYFTQRIGKSEGSRELREEVLENKYQNYWFDGIEENFAQERQYDDSGNSLRALYERRKKMNRFDDAPTIKGEDWGTLLKLDVETAKALYGESIGLPEEMRFMNKTKGKDMTIEELAPNWGRPTRTMLNRYKCPKDWLNEVINMRISEIFEGRSKIERFLTKSELIGFDKEIVTQLSFENMRRSVMKFFRMELSELNAVREAFRASKDFQEIQRDYDVNDEKYLKHQTYYDDAKNPDLYFHQLAYKLTKQRREKMKAQDLPKPPKVIQYNLTKLDHMILNDMKHRLTKPPDQINPEDYEVKPILRPKKYSEVQHLSQKGQTDLQKAIMVAKGRRYEEKNDSAKVYQVLEKMMDAVERKEVQDSEEAQLKLKSFFDEIYK